MPLIRYFAKRIREAYDIDDLVQEVFIRLVRQAAIESVQQIDSYVFQTAANVIRDRARRHAARHHREHHELSETDLPTNDLSPERVLLGRSNWIVPSPRCRNYLITRQSIRIAPLRRHAP